MAQTSPIAIIGGTGVGSFALEGDATHPQIIETPWGEASVRVGRLRGREVVFLARHGAGHRIPPHRINYRANIAALAQMGVRAALATTAVGGLRLLLAPGALMVPDDLIDFALVRTGKTFFDGQQDAPVVHTEVSRPYSDAVRAVVLAAASDAGIAVHPAGVYLCADGPRYETAAEVRLFASWGGDVVGMTGVPEATLAREAGIHYAAISLVTNPGAGLTLDPPSHAEVEAAMRDAQPRLHALLAETIARLDADTLPPIGPGVPLPASGG